MHFHYVFPLSRFLPDLPHLPTHPGLLSSFKKQNKEHNNPQIKSNKQAKDWKLRKCPNKAEWNKSPQKCHWVPFGLAKYGWPWGLPWCTVDIPNETPPEKTDFQPSSWQLQIPSWLGVRTCVHFPLSVLRLRMSWSCVDCHNLCKFTFASTPCVWKIIVVALFPPLLDYSIHVSLIYG